MHQATKRIPFSKTFNLFCFLTILVIQIIKSVSNNGIANTTINSAKEKGNSDIIHCSGNPIILNIPRDTAYSVKFGNKGSKKYISAAIISGIKQNIHLSHKGFLFICGILSNILGLFHIYICDTAP